MDLPFFYIKHYDGTSNNIVLDEGTSKHVVQVLRMKVGERLNLTDGKGNLLTCEITDDHKKYCSVEIKETRHKAQGNLLHAGSGGQARKVSVALSLLKNTNRFEWFLEKATEIGVAEIIPLICERTEKEKFRFERMQGICISAMLQSQQTWLPVLHEPVQFSNMEKWKCANSSTFIAHCIDVSKQALSNCQIAKLSNCQICIGPEGDFTPGEIKLALENNFVPVSLGETRLRTETAGVVAATLLCHI